MAGNNLNIQVWAQIPTIVEREEAISYGNDGGRNSSILRRNPKNIDTEEWEKKNRIYGKMKSATLAGN